MYHIIDEDKVKAYYFNRIIRNELEDLNYIDIRNVRYTLDQQLQITKISIIDLQKPAYIITTNGFVKWDPPYGITYYKRKYALSFIKEENYVIFPIDYFYTRPICLGYVCWKTIPTNPIQITKDDFNCNKEIKIDENEKELVIDSNRWVIRVLLEDKIVDLLYLDFNIKTIILTKGTCFFLYAEKKTVCY